MLSVPFGQCGLWDQAGGIHSGVSWNDCDGVTDTEKEQLSLLLLYSEKKELISWFFYSTPMKNKPRKKLVYIEFILHGKEISDFQIFQPFFLLLPALTEHSSFSRMGNKQDKFLNSVTAATPVLSSYLTGMFHGWGIPHFTDIKTV